MNMMRTEPQRTAAETALIAAYDERLSELPGDGAVIVKRDNAIERLKAGLPTKRIEAWHYTDLRRMLASVPRYDEAADARQVEAVLEGSTVLVVLNGASTGRTPLIEGVTVRRLEDKLRDGKIGR